jgi:hypothetical protein
MNLSRTLPAAATAALALALTVATPSPTSASPTVAKKKHGVTATASATDVVQGDDIVLKGTVTKAGKGERVVLEVRYDGGSWKKTTVTDKLDGQGRFKLVDEIGSGRSRDYRVLAPATGKVKAGRSKALPVTVYSWRNLSSYAPVRSEGTYVVDSARMNAIDYGKSVVTSVQATSGGAEYNLDRKCRELLTTTGIWDGSPSDGSASVRLSTDGTQQFAGTYGLTQTAQVSIPLVDVFRFAFDWTTTAGTSAVLGTPLVLCRD